MPTPAGLDERTYRDEIQSLSREALECLQLEKLNTLLAQIVPANRFYQKKLGDLTALESLEQLKHIPFTNKSELLSEGLFRQQPDLAGRPIRSIPSNFGDHRETSGCSGYSR